MKFKELKKLDEKQLTDQMREARLELAKERAASEIGTVKNPGRIRAVRRTIARIHTIVNAREEAKLLRRPEELGSSKTKRIAAPVKTKSAVKLEKK